LKRNPIVVAALLVLSAFLVSCSSAYNPNTGTIVSTNTSSTTPSGLAIRVFVSNPVAPTGIAGVNANVLDIMDAVFDQLSTSTVNVANAEINPGLMALSPNQQFLLVFSTSGVANTIAVVETATEALATNSSGTTITIVLPGLTESMFIAADNATGYAAVPAAPVAGANPTLGAVYVFNVTTGTTIATIPVPAARFVVGSHAGNRVLAFGENSNNATVTVLTPSLIGTANDPRTTICCFDHPVWGGFSSDDSTAYILNCGPECGGTTAGISVIDMNTDTAGPIIPLPGAGATTGLMVGSTLYVAGSPPGMACGSGTAAPTCGTLDIVNLATAQPTVTNSKPIVITDGYHRLMGMSNNGQLYIGATTCSNVSTPSEVRGCLSVYNTGTAMVVIPPDNGDVTGIQPIANRDVVYLCEGGFFRIYSTDTNTLYVPPLPQTPVIIVGKPTDLKEVDY